MSSTSAPTGAMPSDTENQNKPPTGVSTSGTSTFVTAAALTGTANHGSTVSTVYVIPTTQPLQNFDYSYQYQRSAKDTLGSKVLPMIACKLQDKLPEKMKEIFEEKQLNADVVVRTEEEQAAFFFDEMQQQDGEQENSKREGVSVSG